MKLMGKRSDNNNSIKKVYANALKYRLLIGFWLVLPCLVAVFALKKLLSWQLQLATVAHIQRLMATENGLDIAFAQPPVIPIDDFLINRLWYVSMLPLIALIALLYWKFFHPLINFMFEIKRIHYIEGGNKKVSLEETVNNFISSYAELMRKFSLPDRLTFMLYENSLLVSKKLPTQILFANFLANICSHDHRWVIGHIYVYDSETKTYHQTSTYASHKFQRLSPMINATFLNIFNNQLDDTLKTFQQTNNKMIINNYINEHLNDYYASKVKSLHIRSSMVYPIILDNQIYAIVELLAKHNFFLSKEDSNVLQIINQQLTLALSEQTNNHIIKEFHSW